VRSGALDEQVPIRTALRAKVCQTRGRWASWGGCCYHPNGDRREPETQTERLRAPTHVHLREGGKAICKLHMFVMPIESPCECLAILLRSVATRSPSTPLQICSRLNYWARVTREVWVHWFRPTISTSSSYCKQIEHIRAVERERCQGMGRKTVATTVREMSRNGRHTSTVAITITTSSVGRRS
jgi:hypothetical protein